MSALPVHLVLPRRNNKNVVVCADLSGKEPHRHVRLVASGSLGNRCNRCHASSRIMRSVGLDAALGAIFPIFTNPHHTDYHDQGFVQATLHMVVEATLCICKCIGCVDVIVSVKRLMDISHLTGLPFEGDKCSSLH